MTAPATVRTAPPRRTRRLNSLLVAAVTDSCADDVLNTLVRLIAITVLGLNSTQLGVLTSLPMLAALLIGIPLGKLTDITSPSAALVGATVVRIIASASLCALALTNHLTTWGVFLVMSCTATADIAYMNAQTSAVAQAASGKSLSAAFARIQVLTSTVNLAVPGALALLLFLSNPVQLLWLPPLIYFLTLPTLLIGNRPKQERVEGTMTPKPHSKGGFALLFSNRLLRGFTLSTALVNFGVMAGSSALGIYMLRDLSLRTSTYTLIGSLSACTALIAALLSQKIGAAIGLGWTRVSASLLGACAISLLFLTTWIPQYSAIVYVVSTSIWSFSVVTIGLSGRSTIPVLIPSEVLTQTMAALRAISLGIMPIAAVIGGILADEIGPLWAIGLWGVAVLASLIPWFRAGIGTRRSVTPNGDL